jgi:Zn-dependent protease
MLSITLVLNVALLLFNLIPLPPMDGASVLAGFVGPFRRLHDAILATPFGSFGGLLVAWILFPSFFPFVLLRVLRWLYA